MREGEKKTSKEEKKVSVNKRPIMDSSNKNMINANAKKSEHGRWGQAK